MTEEALGLLRALTYGQEPELSGDELADLYLLRRHLGIEPEDALYRRPPWVIDLLAEGLRTELYPPDKDGADPGAGASPSPRREADWRAFDELGLDL